MIYAVIGAVLAGVTGGWTVRDWKADADRAAAVKKAEKERAALQARVDAVSGEYEEFRNKQNIQRVETRNTIREIYRNVPVRIDCAAPDPAIGLLEQRVQAANAAASGQLVEPLPDLAGTAEAPGRPR
jgi:uncharacterized protein YPO0396